MKRGDKVIYRKGLKDIAATILRKKPNGYLIEQRDGRHVTVKADELKPFSDTSPEKP